MYLYMYMYIYIYLKWIKSNLSEGHMIHGAVGMIMALFCQTSHEQSHERPSLGAQSNGRCMEPKATAAALSQDCSCHSVSSHGLTIKSVALM